MFSGIVDDKEVKAMAASRIAAMLKDASDLQKLDAHKSVVRSKQAQWQAQLTSNVKVILEDADTALALLQDGRHLSLIHI